MRKRRVILTLQAIYDDSGCKGTGRYLVVGGLLGEAELFASIADEWDKWLRAKHPGSIRYFKMEEATGLTGEFRHWHPERRDEKVRQMARLIDRQDIVSIACVIDLVAYQRLAAEWTHVRGSHANNQPYILGFITALAAAVKEAIDRGATSPIEVVFDNQDVFREDLLRDYQSMRRVVHDELQQAVLPIQPWFRDDMDFVMLQAADLVAGEVRLVAENPNKRPVGAGMLSLNLPLSKHSEVLDESTLLKMHTHSRIRELLSRWGL
jgi:hypothetical protein